jgi:hypothetical protein
MSVEIVVMAILGTAQGFVFIPWVIGLLEPFVRKILPHEPHWLPKLIGRICVFVCLLTTHLGLGLVWMGALGSVSNDSEYQLFKAWLGAGLIGMFVYLGTAKMRRTSDARTNPK